jgi:glycosyltransferase involved in cell wall biosynthesis
MDGVGKSQTSGKKAPFVSVIIPVYNAENYARQAVESALMQPETGEVLLIEDASADKSLAVCQGLSREYKKVKLLRHEDGKNHGAGASRNLGLKNAALDYIAFLDADDFFLPGRFSVATAIFNGDPKTDGVYEAIGVHFQNKAAELLWENSGRKMLTTMSQKIAPEILFEEASPIGASGYCSLDAWVIKKSVFSKTGLFDEHLRLHQDTAMFVKFAALCTMVPGRLNKPVAMRRVHDHNRITAPRSAIDTYKSRLLMWLTLWKWGKINLTKARQQILLRRFISHASRPYKKTTWSFINIYISIFQLIFLFLKYPTLWLEMPALLKTLLFSVKKGNLLLNLSSPRRN